MATTTRTERPRLIGFPQVVNEKAARSVAAIIAVTAWVIVATGWLWLLVPLAYGFWARVLTGPRLSPVARLATGVIAARLGPPKLVPGPPKRFAQGIGATLSSAALLAALTGASTLAVVLTALVGIAASLEAVLGFCLGCKLFGLLMRVGIIPASACEACNDLSLRWAESS
jgi:hypothetical protein